MQSCPPPPGCGVGANPPAALREGAGPDSPFLPHANFPVAIKGEKNKFYTDFSRAPSSRGGGVGESVPAFNCPYTHAAEGTGAPAPAGRAAGEALRGARARTEPETPGWAPHGLRCWQRKRETRGNAGFTAPRKLRYVSGTISLKRRGSALMRAALGAGRFLQAG